jgi:glycosyltransferase involved in cell wall biosynthesis
MPADRVRVVRNGPMLERVRQQPPLPEYKRGCRYLVGYLGTIAEAEGIDLLLHIAREICDRRQDVHFAIVGSGPDLASLKAMSARLGLEPHVEFHGRVSDQNLLDILNTADVCVNPDRPSEMNDLSTRNKIMEYMALKKPIVQYDLKEGRVTAGDAALYAKCDSTSDFADKIIRLLDNEEQRRRMGEVGYQRIVHELCWDIQARNYVEFYAEILGAASRPPAPRCAAPSPETSPR